MYYCVLYANFKNNINQDDKFSNRRNIRITEPQLKFIGSVGPPFPISDNYFVITFNTFQKLITKNNFLNCYGQIS